MINPSLYYTPRDVIRLAKADLFPVRSRTTLQRMLKSGLIHHIRVGNGTRQNIKIKGEELLRYMQFGNSIGKLVDSIHPVELNPEDHEVKKRVQRKDKNSSR